MRNLVGQNGVSVSLHGDGDRVIIDGSGSGGIDPAYMTLANDKVTVHKTMEAQAITAASLGIGAGGGIMRFANITAALGGVIYANSGLECTTMVCQGIDNTDTLNVTQDTTCNGSITLPNDLALGGKITRAGAGPMSCDGRGNMNAEDSTVFRVVVQPLFPVV